MNVDQGYQDISIFESYSPNTQQIGNLPRDYFYSNDYDYLTLPEVQLLLTLSDSQISYSFSGLRKTTSLHQHQLTKAIKRLQSREFLIRNKSGSYELTDLGSKYTRELLNELINKKAVSIKNNRYYLQCKKYKIIPPFSQEELTEKFEKRWFSNFRYLYKKETNLEIMLCWEDNDGNRVNITIDKNGELEIEYKSLQPDYSNFQLVLNWIIDDISSQEDVVIHSIKQKIKDNIDKIPYN